MSVLKGIPEVVVNAGFVPDEQDLAAFGGSVTQLPGGPVSRQRVGSSECRKYPDSRIGGRNRNRDRGRGRGSRGKIVGRTRF
jgi:hypothetical protein